MLEPTGAGLPPPAAAHKTNPLVIVLLVLVLLCCFCIGALGLLLAFGGPLLNELGLLHSQLPALVL
jgi:hypothetical protein